MNRNLFAIWIFIIVGFLFTDNIWSQEFKSRVKIDFEKSPKVKLAQKTSIKIKLEALEQVQNVDIDISLPAHTTLLNGNTRHNKDFMKKGERWWIKNNRPDSAMLNRMVEMNLENRRQWASIFMCLQPLAVKTIRFSTAKQERCYMSNREVQNIIIIQPLKYQSTRKESVSCQEKLVFL